MNTPHKHAESIRQYAEDWCETNKPWQRWEFTNSEQVKWLSIEDHPQWHDYFEYRRKPKTININGFEVPEPLRVAPGIGDVCYSAMPPYSVTVVWSNHVRDNDYLKSGLIHATLDAAELHRKALISFTAKGDA